MILPFLGLAAVAVALLAVALALLEIARALMHLRAIGIVTRHQQDTDDA